MKDLLKTKTFWSGVASIVTGVGFILAGEAPQGINAIAIGIIAICVRDGIMKLTKQIG